MQEHHQNLYIYHQAMPVFIESIIALVENSAVTGMVDLSTLMKELLL